MYAHGGVQEGAQDGAAEEPHEDRQEHAELSDVVRDLGPLDLAAIAALAAAPQQDHRGPPGRGADVCGGARNVCRAHDGAKVHGAHGVLQAAGHGCQASGGHSTRLGDSLVAHWVCGGDKARCDEQTAVAHQCNTIERLAAKVNLVLRDNKSQLSFMPVVTPSSRIPTLATVPVTWLTKTERLRAVTASTTPAQVASNTPKATIHTFGATKPGFGAGLTAETSVCAELTSSFDSTDWMVVAIGGSSRSW
mmetsp:Transcript_88214/g.234223  ORF Transcript_88214/g.234223 Transcript_88214/m.234223 type:complete len:249 (+) Transcript_88214:418-1164(+)